MKKLFYSSLFMLFFSSFMNAQSTDSTKTLYCRLHESSLMTFSESVSIDLGSSSNFFNVDLPYLYTQKNGKLRTFESMIDGLNYMSGYGWEFVQAYSIYESDRGQSYYILKQHFTKNSDGTYSPLKK